MMPVWSHDGKQIAFVSNRKGGVFNMYVKASNGIGEDQVLLETPNNKAISDWSADGRFIAYRGDRSHHEERPLGAATHWRPEADAVALDAGR